MSNNSSKHMQVDGIEFWATQSRYSSPTGNYQDGQVVPFNILQRAFTFEDSTTDSSAIQGQYLSVRLNYRTGSVPVTADSIGNSNNCIIVSGMAAREAGGGGLSVGEDVIRFEHVFITNFMRESIAGYYAHYTWDFQDQFPNATNWAPVNTAGEWKNGGDAVNGNNWEGSTTVYKFGCEDGTTSSGGTGPDGGMGGNDPFVTIPTNGLKYLYTEASSNRYQGQFVTRLPGINFSELMQNTSNGLYLNFYYQNYASTSTNTNMKIRVYIDTSATSNHSNATLLYTNNPVPIMTAPTQRYEPINGISNINLNDYRTVDADHYLYIVAEGGTGFRSDLALDYFQILEDNVAFTKYETAFTQQVAQGSNGTLIISNSVDWVSPNPQDDRQDPTLNFRLHSRDGVDLYVKGTYLLM